MLPVRTPVGIGLPVEGSLPLPGLGRRADVGDGPPGRGHGSFHDLPASQPCRRHRVDVMAAPFTAGPARERAAVGAGAAVAG